MTRALLTGMTVPTYCGAVRPFQQAPELALSVDANALLLLTPLVEDGASAGILHVLYRQKKDKTGARKQIFLSVCQSIRERNPMSFLSELREAL